MTLHSHTQVLNVPSRQQDGMFNIERDVFHLHVAAIYSEFGRKQLRRRDALRAAKAVLSVLRKVDAEERLDEPKHFARPQTAWF